MKIKTLKLIGAIIFYLFMCGLIIHSMILKNITSTAILIFLGVMILIMQMIKGVFD